MPPPVDYSKRVVAKLRNSNWWMPGSVRLEFGQSGCTLWAPRWNRGHSCKLKPYGQNEILVTCRASRHHVWSYDIHLGTSCLAYVGRKYAYRIPNEVHSRPFTRPTKKATGDYGKAPKWLRYYNFEAYPPFAAWKRDWELRLKKAKNEFDHRRLAQARGKQEPSTRVRFAERFYADAREHFGSLWEHPKEVKVEIMGAYDFDKNRYRVGVLLDRVFGGWYYLLCDEVRGEQLRGSLRKEGRRSFLTARVWGGWYWEVGTNGFLYGYHRVAVGGQQFELIPK